MTTATYQNFSGTGAALYERFFVPAIATPVSVEFIQTAALEPGERVLDVACGTGVITRLAAAAVGATGSVTGLDLAPDMIEVASSTPPPPGAQIDWQQADASSIPLPDESYDVVLCQMGIMFMENKGSALTEMHRVLAPGGRVVINTPGRIQPLFEAMEQGIVDHIDPELGAFVRAVFSMPDPSALETMLADAGFRDTASSEYVAEFDLPGPAEFLWQYINLTPMGPLVANAPEGSKSAMEAQVVEAWAPEVVDGRVPLAQPMAIAVGHRE